jgi:hypothetical protein
MVDKHSFEAVANCLVHQLRGYSRIHSSTNSTQNLALGTHEISNTSNLLIHEAGHCPVLLDAADVNGEVSEEL